MKATDGSKVLRADDPADPLNRAPDLLGVADELIRQAWVEGGDDCMHSLFVCLTKKAAPSYRASSAGKFDNGHPTSASVL